MPDFNAPPSGQPVRTTTLFCRRISISTRYRAAVSAGLHQRDFGQGHDRQEAQRNRQKADRSGEEPEMVPRKSRPALWLDRNRAVMEMTWAPGEPQLMEGLLASEGGWIEREGVSTYNLYPTAGRVCGRSCQCLALGRSGGGDLPGTCRSHHRILRAPGATAARKDQPCAGADGIARDRQGYVAGTVETWRRPLEFQGNIAARYHRKP